MIALRREEARKRSALYWELWSWIHSCWWNIRPSEAGPASPHQREGKSYFSFSEGAFVPHVLSPQVIIKSIEKSKVDLSRFHEIEAMKRLFHPHVIRLLEVIEGLSADELLQFIWLTTVLL